jgi:acid phosphatase (class A)
MIQKVIFILLILTSFCSRSQNPNPIEPVSGIYKELQMLSPDQNSVRAWMDTIQYPPSEYGNSLTFVLVKPHYLKQEEVKSISESVSFPANSSDQTRKELDYLLELQGKRTLEQKQRVEFLANIGYWPQTNLLPNHLNYKQNLQDLFFEGREILGSQLTHENFPKISKLLEGVMEDMRIMEFTVKYKLLRPRPYHLESRLESMAKINSPSFASGHTLWAFIQAFTWSEIVPEKRKYFIELAEEIRQSREIMGIHFPSDNEAARQLSYTMLQAYFKNDRFKNDLGDAIEEWKLASKQLK